MTAGCHVIMWVVLYLRTSYLYGMYNMPFLDTHALVRFLEDKCTAIVPVGSIEKKDNLEYNGSCKVKWSNRKLYYAFLLFSGTEIILYFIFYAIIYHIHLLTFGMINYLLSVIKGVLRDEIFCD